ncbi:MAG: glycosyltransferase [Bacteroidaceae bacterium]|nr:glycosyltransferase [Bacteroidaceae bacterium]
MQLSIIVPYYNIKEKFLFRCLSNVFSMKIRRDEYEVILVDDGSKYEPTRVKDAFSTNKRLVWLKQPHRGLGAARNLGLRHARGEYVLFLDADDYLYRHTLPPLLEHAVKTGCDILRFGYRYCHSMEEETVEQPARLQFTSPMDGNNYLRTHHLPSMACVYLFRLSMCMGMNLQFAEDGFIEDEAFTAILHFNARRIVESNSIVYAYYQRPGSITQTLTPKRQKALIRYHFRAICEIHDYYKEQRGLRRPLKGLERKLNALTVDFIRRILVRDNWREEWKNYVGRLKEMKLFPLHGVNYTMKYRVFSILANCSLGRLLLRELLLRDIH